MNFPFGGSQTTFTFALPLFVSSSSLKLQTKFWGKYLDFNLRRVREDGNLGRIRRKVEFVSSSFQLCIVHHRRHYQQSNLMYLQTRCESLAVHVAT